MFETLVLFHTGGHLQVRQPGQLCQGAPETLPEAPAAAEGNGQFVEVEREVHRYFRKSGKRKEVFFQCACMI